MLRGSNNSPTHLSLETPAGLFKTVTSYSESPNRENVSWNRKSTAMARKRKPSLIAQGNQNLQMKIQIIKKNKIARTSLALVQHFLAKVLTCQSLTLLRQSRYDQLEHSIAAIVKYKTLLIKPAKKRQQLKRMLPQSSKWRIIQTQQFINLYARSYCPIDAKQLQLVP